MKKLLSSFLVIIMVISMVGCNNTNEESISLVEHNELMDELKTNYELKLSEKQSEVIALPKMESKGMFAGELIYNEERDIFAYIDDVGFEVIGNVNLYDPKTGESTQITSYEYNGTDSTVKKIAWLSDNQLLVIVGFAMGTVTVGGSLYVLSIDTGEMKEILVHGDQEEIIDIVVPDGGSWNLIFVIAKWDDNSMEYETYNVEYNYGELRQMAETDEVLIVSPNTYKQKEISSLSKAISGDVWARLVKETDQDLLINVHGYGQTDDYILQVDKETYEVIKNINLGKVDTYSTAFKIRDDGLLLKTNEDIKLYNDVLELVKTYELPQEIKDAINMSSDQNRFGGYDVNEDLSRFVFSDEEGMKLIDGKTTMIVEPLFSGNPDGSLGGYPRTPTFVGNQDNVMAMISGYEGYTGFYYYHRAEDELQVYSGGCDRNFPGFYQGSDLINISPFYSDGYGDGYILNANDGTRVQLDRDHIDNDGNMIDSSLYFDMDNQIFSIDEKNSVSQLLARNEQGEIIYQGDLKSDAKWVKFKIIGVTEEGKVLLLEDDKDKKVIEISLVEK